MGKYKISYLVLFIGLLASMMVVLPFLGFLGRGRRVLAVGTGGFSGGRLGSSHSPLWSYALDGWPHSVAISSDGSYIVVATTTIYLLDNNRTLLWSR